MRQACSDLIIKNLSEEKENNSRDYIYPVSSRARHLRASRSDKRYYSEKSHLSLPSSGHSIVKKVADVSRHLLRSRTLSLGSRLRSGFYVDSVSLLTPCRYLFFLFSPFLLPHLSSFWEISHGLYLAEISFHSLKRCMFFSVFRCN